MPFEITELKKVKIIPNDINDFWTSEMMKKDVFKNVLLNGYQSNIRKDIKDENVELLKLLKSKNAIFEDAFLESYISQFIQKLLPNSSILGSQTIFVPKIYIDPIPNASVTPTGIIFLSTGLMSLVESEQELLAILAHEISHFYLDHSIINYNKAVQRQKRAEFWAVLATSVAAATDAYIAIRNNNYTPGILTESTAILSSIISSSVLERLGRNFTKHQEEEADECAIQLLNFLKIDTSNLSSVFIKTKNYFISVGDLTAISSSDTHPSLDERINKAGSVVVPSDPNFIKLFSNISTYMAWWHYQNLDYMEAQRLVTRNINNNTATESDFLISAMILIMKEDTQTSNSNALELLEKGKLVNVFPTFTIDKYESIVFTRLNQKDKAILALDSYEKALESEEKIALPLANSEKYSQYVSFLDREMNWAKSMRYRLK